MHAAELSAVGKHSPIRAAQQNTTAANGTTRTEPVKATVANHSEAESCTVKPDLTRLSPRAGDAALPPKNDENRLTTEGNSVETGERLTLQKPSEEGWMKDRLQEKTSVEEESRSETRVSTNESGRQCTRNAETPSSKPARIN
jgi:hypothetical protein